MNITTARRKVYAAQIANAMAEGRTDDALGFVNQLVTEATTKTQRIDDIHDAPLSCEIRQSGDCNTDEGYWIVDLPNGTFRVACDACLGIVETCLACHYDSCQYTERKGDE